MQETFSIGIGGPDCTERKRDLQRAAKEKGMSVSGFVLWLFDQYKARQERRKANAGAGR